MEVHNEVPMNVLWFEIICITYVLLCINFALWTTVQTATMKCTHCNEETDHINRQDHTQICESCEASRIENNVLAFLHRNLHGNNHEDVINQCIGIFKNSEDIAEAKESIINVYGNKIQEIDSKLYAEIKKKSSSRW